MGQHIVPTSPDIFVFCFSFLFELFLFLVFATFCPNLQMKNKCNIINMNMIKIDIINANIFVAVFAVCKLCAKL